MLKGLFVNNKKAKDSIYESGYMAYECLKLSQKYQLDYCEVDIDNRKINLGYDFYFFNYHPVTMSWLDTKNLKKDLGFVITMILEVAPNDAFVFCPKNHFNFYCALDPTIKESKNLYSFPRPLEKFDFELNYQETEVPVIGSFGFATKGKGFEHVVEAVNKEFSKAIIKINIPFGDFVPESEKYAFFLSETCKKIAKPGIEVVVTHDFMTKEELIKWCASNTLNCFLYDRNMPGLAATTDQAIISNRPLSVSDNDTFRHITSYLAPYPKMSLMESIEKSAPIVKKMENDWMPENFSKKFEHIILNQLKERVVKNNCDNNFFTLPIIHNKLRNRLNKRIKKYQRLLKKIRVKNLVNLLINMKLFRKIAKTLMPETQLGYSQFGEDLILAHLFNQLGIKNPSYLDIGANEPRYISNTYFFYLRGSKGVLIEPNPYLYKKLKSKRPNDIVVNTGIGFTEVDAADFFVFPNYANGLSTFSEKEARHWEEIGMKGLGKIPIEKVIKMSLIPIDNIFQKYFNDVAPNFISLDVEGLDLEILKSINFNKYKPEVICVETLAYDENQNTFKLNDIIDFMNNKGYEVYADTRVNTIFCRKDLFVK